MNEEKAKRLTDYIEKEFKGTKYICHICYTDEKGEEDMNCVFSAATNLKSTTERYLIMTGIVNTFIQHSKEHINIIMGLKSHAKSNVKPPDGGYA